MLLTLLIVTAVAGIALGLTALYVLTAKTKPAEALAGETTLAGMRDPASETLGSGHDAPPRPRAEWHLATVTSLSDAEELLDTLECQGFAERELVVLGNSTFVVRWR